MSSQGQEEFTDNSPNERLNFDESAEKEIEQKGELEKSNNEIDFNEENIAEGYKSEIIKDTGFDTEINDDFKNADDDSESKNEDNTN
jgi:hypothetical protein